MTIPVLTRDQVLSTLRDIIKAKGPDYTYNEDRPKGHQCVYKWHKAPSCVVGHLVARVAPDVFKSIGRPNDPNVPSNSSASWSLIASEDSPFDGTPLWAETFELAQEIRALQSYQDSGYTWYKAFEMAFGEPVELEEAVSA